MHCILWNLLQPFKLLIKNVKYIHLIENGFNLGHIYTHIYIHSVEQTYICTLFLGVWRALIHREIKKKKIPRKKGPWNTDNILIQKRKNNLTEIISFGAGSCLCLQQLCHSAMKQSTLLPPPFCRLCNQPGPVGREGGSLLDLPSSTWHLSRGAHTEYVKINSVPH